MTALFQIANEYLALAETLAGLDLDAVTVADTIEASGITDELSVKAQGLEYVARGALAHNPAIDAEIARLQALKASREMLAAGLRKYLLDNMERAGITSIDCPLFSIRIRKNPPAVDILDSLSLPAEYWTQPPTPAQVPNKVAIKLALQAGNEVMGAKLVSGSRLDIK